MHDRRLTLLAAVALAMSALVGAGGRAGADGAVAVGSTGDVVRDGIAFGMVVNQPREKAAEIAIQRCRTFQARAAAEQCKVVATFSGECFAVAYDPKPATPGAGWGIGPDQLAANDKAIAMCQETAGPARKRYCQVESGGCDTTGRREKRSEAPSAAPQAHRAQATAEVSAGAKAGRSTAEAAGGRTAEGTAAPALQPPPAASSAAKPKALESADATGRRRGPLLLPVAALAGVGAAYSLGQLAKGRLKGGIGEGQILVGSALALGAAVLAAVLDLAGVQPTVAVAMAGIVALAAAIFA